MERNHDKHIFRYLVEPPHEINYPKNNNEKYLKHQKTACLAQLPTKPDAVKSKKKMKF